MNVKGPEKWALIQDQWHVYHDCTVGANAEILFRAITFTVTVKILTQRPVTDSSGWTKDLNVTLCLANLLGNNNDSSGLAIAITSWNGC